MKLLTIITLFFLKKIYTGKWYQQKENFDSRIFKRLLQWGMTPIKIILSWFFRNLEKTLYNIPAQTLGKFEIWRLLTPPFAQPSLIGYFLEMLMFVPAAMVHEHTIGTVRYFCYFLLSCIVMQTGYALLALLLSIAIPAVALTYSHGLFPMLLCETVLECAKSPEIPKQFLCFPFKIKAKYYPWILLALSTLFSQMQVLPLLMGVGVGYLHFYKCLNKLYDFPPEQAHRIESNWFFSELRNIEGFVSVDAAQELAFANSEMLPRPANNIPHESLNLPQIFPGKGNMVGTTERNDGSTENPASIVVDDLQSEVPSKQEEPEKNKAPDSTEANLLELPEKESKSE